MRTVAEFRIQYLQYLDAQGNATGELPAFASDNDLNTQIAAFQAQHAAANGELLAMDSRRALGPSKVRVTFRVRPKKGSR